LCTQISDLFLNSLEDILGISKKKKDDFIYQDGIFRFQEGLFRLEVGFFMKMVVYFMKMKEYFTKQP